MDKLSRYSIDGVRSNIDRLAELFPQCVTEALDEARSTPEQPVYRRAVNFGLLRQLLSPDIVEGSEAYEFTWPGKKAAIVEANTPTDRTLRPCPSESVDWDSTQNLYIEGDNLEVLKLLQGSYMGKVKLIYIDPPYNTGNDFIYRDDFALGQGEYDSESGAVEDGQRLFRNTDSNGRFHSDWCSMIYARLLLARNLLSEDGVIFISCDDHEQENVNKICNEIFGEDNFVALFPWRKRTAKSDVPFGISQDYEWVVCYARSEKFIARIQGNERRYYETPDYPGRPWRIHDMTTHRTASERPNSYFTIIDPKNGKKYPANPNATWRVTTDTIVDYYEQHRIVFPGDYDFLNISKPVLRYWKDDDMKKTGDMFGMVSVSTKLPDNVGMSLDGTREVTELFERKIFSFPKPAGLIKFLVDISTKADPHAIVLDFFSGSATTAHAVMQLNAEDGGHRRFIMVQLPEACAPDSEAYRAGFANICEIGKERIRRAAKKIRGDAGMTLPQDFDGGFRVLKLDEGNYEDISLPAGDYDQGQLGMMLANLRKDRDELDLLFGCLLRWNLPLSLPCRRENIAGCTVLDYNDGDLLACFDDDVPEEVVREMARRHPLRAVFKDSSFADSPARINVEEIFKQAGAQDKEGRQTSVKVL